MGGQSIINNMVVMVYSMKWISENIDCTRVQLKEICYKNTLK